MINMYLKFYLFERELKVGFLPRKTRYGGIYNEKEHEINILKFKNYFKS